MISFTPMQDYILLKDSLDAVKDMDGFTPMQDYILLKGQIIKMQGITPG